MINPSLRSEFDKRLNLASQILGVSISQAQSEKLLDYLELLIKWNKAYNLTAIREPEEMFVKHLLDSISIAPYISGENILDVGTGPGLPGIPMAILYPEKKFSLLDSNGKKTRFLVQAKLSLALDNIEISNARVETFSSAKLFDQIMSRAFTALDNMVEICKHLLSNNGQFLAMKGLIPESEIAVMSKEYHVSKVIPLIVPGCTDQRHLVIVQRNNS